MKPHTETAFTKRFKEKKTALGTAVTFSDPSISAAMADALDFLWIDMEHGPLSLESVQGHVLAVGGTETAAIVRVPANDPNLIKPVLDLGAHGVIVPLIQTADDVRRAVAACKYPPEGIRGFGPRRASNYARLGGPDFCRAANAAVITIVQIEQKEAVQNIREILAVPGLTAVVVGPNDLAASLGFTGQTRHPEVLRVIDGVVKECKNAKVPIGIAVGDDPSILAEWVGKGMDWLMVAADFVLIATAAERFVKAVRDAEGARS